MQEVKNQNDVKKHLTAMGVDFYGILRISMENLN